VLGLFLAQAKSQPGASPKRLLRALRTVALKDVEEPEEPPNEVPVEKVVQLAAQLAARSEPIHILDQKLHASLLWNLFQDLSKAGLGKEWRGRRGSKTRFCFHRRLTSDAIRQAFDELGLEAIIFPSKAAPLSEKSSPPEEKPSPQNARLDRENVLSLLRAHGEALRRLGVVSLTLFGSVARNEATEESDVDLLVSFREPITSDAFFATKFLLEDVLGARVDLITESSLRERVRRVIEPELVRVA
jgi:predicted nucleotidyltransferase